MRDSHAETFLLAGVGSLCVATQLRVRVCMSTNPTFVCTWTKHRTAFANHQRETALKFNKIDTVTDFVCHIRSFSSAHGSQA
eukprot:scaffold30033_cov161-Skeletonema_dohrnii-CCMP3373.AAC.1